MAFVIGLMGLGSLNITIGKIDFSYLAYIVPWVAIAFDFYIMGEDYSVKRIGAFLKTQSLDRSERQWEQWVAKNRDPFAIVSLPVTKLHEMMLGFPDRIASRLKDSFKLYLKHKIKS